MPPVRLQTVNLDGKTVDGRLRFSDRICKTSLPLDFDDRVGDFLELSEVTSKVSRKEPSNQGRALTQYVR
jgi:hypothetical protein